VRAETANLLSELIAYYWACAEEERQVLRQLFGDHRSFSWAARLPYKALSDESFRAHLLLFSMKDQGRDTRDAILELQHKCSTAAAAGLEIGPILKEIAEISSDADKYRMGSTRTLLLHEYERQK